MTILNDIEKQLRRRLSELGQGGIHRLGAHEAALDEMFNAIDGLVPHNEELTLAAQKARGTIAALHTYGAEAYVELGLKLRTAETFTGAAGEVQVLSGGGSKNPPPPPGGP